MADEQKPMPEYFGWQFRVEGFGEVGYANLMTFVASPGQKKPSELAMNEMTTGTIRGGEVVRIWRSR
jgi:hypothetical protein